LKPQQLNTADRYAPADFFVEPVEQVGEKNFMKNA